MKTRIIWTKIWDDEWFDSLSNNSRILFIYLLTNQDINLCGCYYITDKKMMYHTHLNKVELKEAKGLLDPKVKFMENWVYIPNSQGYNHFVGKSNEIAIKRELSQIPNNVKSTLFKDKPYTPPTDPLQSINHNLNLNHNHNVEKTYKLIGNTMKEI